MFDDEEPIVSFETAVGLRDMVIEGRPQDEAQPMDVQVFNIRMANSEGRREAASLLIRKMYGWRGYSVEHTVHHEPNKILLYAETGGVTVGTMSLCLDGSAGLPADENFRDRIDGLREHGRMLCEPSRLAIDKGVSKRVFASLIHISYIFAHNIHGFTDYIIEVNPRHVMFYKRMLGFTDFGGQRNCTRVGAPAVLLRLELEYMREQIRTFGGMFENSETERSFYPYFFPVKDEPGITARIVSGRG